MRQDYHDDEDEDDDDKDPEGHADGADDDDDYDDDDDGDDDETMMMMMMVAVRYHACVLQIQMLLKIFRQCPCTTQTSYNIVPELLVRNVPVPACQKCFSFYTMTMTSTSSQTLSTGSALNTHLNIEAKPVLQA